MTTFVLAVGNDQVHLAQFQLASAQQLLHFLRLQHQVLLLIVPKAFFKKYEANLKARRRSSNACVQNA
jgi:hypothetical protein